MKNLFFAVVATVFAGVMAGCANAGDNRHVTTWQNIPVSMHELSSGTRIKENTVVTGLDCSGKQVVVQSVNRDVSVEQRTGVVVSPLGIVTVPPPAASAVAVPTQTYVPTTTQVVVDANYQTQPVSPVQNTYVNGGYVNGYVSSPVGGYVSTPVSGYVTSPIGGTVTTGPVHHGHGYSYQTVVTRGH